MNIVLYVFVYHISFNIETVRHLKGKAETSVDIPKR